jgi:hypothetical protein
MTKEKAQEAETTFAGLMEAATEGQLSAEELLKEMEAHPEWLTEDPASDAMKAYTNMAKSGQLPMGKDEACNTPGMKKRSKGKGRGLARGKGKGPIGKPAGEKDEAQEPQSAIVTDQALAVAGSTFESLVAKAESTPRQKQQESIHEFAAPERQDVILWARGNAPKRTEPKNPFYFQENQMFSHKQAIAVRDLEEKTARVIHPNRLDAVSGRHAVLAQKGLRYAGYKVEFVDEL